MRENELAEFKIHVIQVNICISVIIIPIDSYQVKTGSNFVPASTGRIKQQFNCVLVCRQGAANKQC